MHLDIADTKIALLLGFANLDAVHQLEQDGFIQLRDFRIAPDNVRPAVGVLPVSALRPDLLLQFREGGGFFRALGFIFLHQGLEHGLRDNALAFVLVEILHQLFQFRNAGGRRFQLLFIRGQATAGFLILQTGDLRHKPVPVVLRVLSFFPDIRQHELTQDILINHVDSAGGFPAAAVVAADEGVKYLRMAVAVLARLIVGPHFEAAVGAVDKAGENAFSACGGGRFPYFLLVDTDHGIPHVAGNDCFVGVFHPYPFILRLYNELAGFIGERPVLALYHISDINLIAEDNLNGSVGPLVVNLTRVVLPFALIVQHSGRLNSFLVERHGDGPKAHALTTHGEDTSHNRRGFLVDHKMVLIRGVALVAVGGIGSHEFSVLRTRFLHGLDLLAGIPAVELVK